jgi:hypothetical protein
VEGEQCRMESCVGGMRSDAIGCADGGEGGFVRGREVCGKEMVWLMGCSVVPESRQVRSGAGPSLPGSVARSGVGW